MRHRGIERQTLLVALIPILVMAVLMENHFIYARFSDLDGALLERSQLLARQLASSSEYAVFSGNTALLQQEVDATMAQQDVEGVTVLDASSAVLAAKRRGPSVPGAAAKVGPARPVYQDDAMLVLYQPIVATQVKLDDLGSESGAASGPPKPLGAVIVEIGKQRLGRQKNEMLVFNLLATLFVLMLTLAVALWSARRITGPILAMSSAIRRIGQGELDTRLPPQSRVHELDELAAGINQMAQQLQQDRTNLQARVDEATRELRQKKEEAENASRDKTRFLAAASHDLRQPMHALGLFVGQLRSKVATPEQIGIVKQIEASAEAMADLLDELLDISKLDAGVVVPRVLAFPIGPLLGRMAQDYAPVAAKKGIRLRVRPCDAVVASDPVLLERILSNLLNNALNYTPPQGGVLVACRRSGQRVRIEVRDSGIGIPPEEQKNIFREFFQVENAARDRSRGLGLGLAIVERLSRLLDHPVSLRSAAGRGSTFAVEVPLHAWAADEDDARRPPGVAEPVSSYGVQADSRLNGARVLLVEDDALVRASTEGMLASWGCTVQVAVSRREGAERCAEGTFDLLVCDYRLPDGSGLDMIAEAEALCRRRVPAILISGDTGPEVLQRVAAGGHRLLHKPVRPAKLRSLMLFLLEGAQEE